MPKENLSDLFKGVKWYEIILSCWPLVLMFIGGAVGGVCGAAACYFNLHVLKKGIKRPFKYLFCILIGAGSVLLYIIIMWVLAVFFPDLFAGSDGQG
jgi:H+/Cl- antiporter ClcA